MFWPNFTKILQIYVAYKFNIEHIEQPLVIWRFIGSWLLVKDKVVNVIFLLKTTFIKLSIDVWSYIVCHITVVLLKLARLNFGVPLNYLSNKKNKTMSIKFKVTCKIEVG